MNKYLQKFKEWFATRNLREKFFVCILSWSLLYAIFSLILFRPVELKTNQLADDLKKTNNQIDSWKLQLKYLKDIPSTPLYKEWVVRHSNYEALKEKYKNLLGDPNDKKWETILKTVLSDYPNITIGAIHHEPEAAYQTSKIKSEPESIYQQQLRLTVTGDFQNIVGYLLYLEKTLPNIHWNTLTYEVKDYPMAEVQMEFSILYEKQT